MLDLKKQEYHFRNHVAKFTDYRNIKILDFKAPGTSNYRIRFLFEEDYCRLHISGDLGHLTATNYNNMCWGKFYEDFSNNSGYFEEKVDCHDRRFYEYDETLARKQLAEWMQDEGVDDDVTESELYLSVDETVNEIIDKLDHTKGLSESGVEMLCKLTTDTYEAYGFASELGKQSTGIIDLYLMAFRLAVKQLNQNLEVSNAKT